MIVTVVMVLQAPERLGQERRLESARSG